MDFFNGRGIEISERSIIVIGDSRKPNATAGALGPVVIEVRK